MTEIGNVYVNVNEYRELKSRLKLLERFPQVLNIACDNYSNVNSLLLKMYDIYQQTASKLNFTEKAKREMSVMDAGIKAQIEKMVEGSSLIRENAEELAQDLGEKVKHQNP